MSQVEEFYYLAAHGRCLEFGDEFGRLEFHIGRNAHLRAENILNLLHKCLRVVVAADANLYLVGTQRVGKHLDYIVLHIGDIVQNIEQHGRVDGRTLELYHQIGRAHV